jgi:hypothetical protein
MASDVLLVGSLPFDTVEEAFTAAAQHIGDHVPGLPDGEVGPRKIWVGFLPLMVYSQNPALLKPETFEPPRQPERRGSRQFFPSPPLWRVQPGAAPDLGGVGYGPIALESYQVFRRLRDAGTIPANVRFQVAFPGTSSAVDFFFEPGGWPVMRRAYHAGVHRAIEMLLEQVPAENLQLQFDVCFEMIDLAGGDAHVIEHWPQRTLEDKIAYHASQLDDLWRGIPEEALLGYHWCYGTWGGWPMIAMPELDLCVRMSNEAARRTGRRLDYVHMPVIRQPDDAFFAHLANLDVGDTYVYLGLVHHTDGVAGFRERARLARRYLPKFGISSVCGYGRVPPEELPHILAVHRECAAELP